jgi:hypothetical protein
MPIPRGRVSQGTHNGTLLSVHLFSLSFVIIASKQNSTETVRLFELAMRYHKQVR